MPYESGPEDITPVKVVGVFCAVHTRYNQFCRDCQTDLHIFTKDELGQHDLDLRKQVVEEIVTGLGEAWSITTHARRTAQRIARLYSVPVTIPDPPAISGDDDVAYFTEPS